MLENFHHFYRTVYLPDHAAPLNRWVHFGSNVCAMAFCLLGLLLQEGWVFALGIWFQLGPPYLGHILFEKTHNSIDQAPIYAALGSWYTTFQIVQGKQCITHGVHHAGEAVHAPPLLDLLRRHGRNLHAFMVLEPGLSTWATEDEDAAVAYADRGGYWVAAGAPLCAPNQRLAVARGFAEAAGATGRGVAFFGVGQPFVDALGDADDFDVLRIGQTPVWHPTAWEDCVATSRKLRNRLNRGRREGVQVRHIEAAEVADGAPMRSRMTDLADAWTRGHALPPMGFMVTLELFQHADERRYFVVEREHELLGFAVCVPVYGRNGWLVEDMLLAPHAPAGTSEVLIDGFMRALAAEGADLVSLGMVALAGIERDAEDDRHPWLMGFLRLCARTMGGLYNFDGLYRFRKKLQPVAWEPVYLVTRGRMTPWTLRAVLMAFAEGWLPRFAVRVLGRWAQRWVLR